MSGVLAFWFAAVVLSASSLPVALALFRRLPDAGAGLAPSLGLLLAGYAYFLLRVAGAVEQGRGGYLVAAALLLVLGASAAARNPRFAADLRRASRGIFVALLVYTAAFALFLGYRSYVPNIEGTEQPMDFMYLNATISSPDYPPHDPWLAGRSASYYYFGYLQAGLLTELAGVRPSSGYNLALAATFGAAAAGAVTLGASAARWALGARARRWVPVGAALAPVLLLATGSLAGVFEWAAAHGQTSERLYSAFGVEFMLPCDARSGEPDRDCYAGPTNPRTTAWYPTEHWFWFRDTRVIPGTITEFPSFSFILGDLHPHVMGIPLVLLVTGMSLTVWRGRGGLGFRAHLRHPLRSLTFATAIGALAFMNAWDVLTFAAVFCTAALARTLRSGSWGTLGPLATFLAPVLLLAFLLYLPWYLTFSSQAGGLYAYAGGGSRPVHLLLQFGPVVVPTLAGLTWALRPRELVTDLTTRGAFALLAVVPLAGWSFLAVARGALAEAGETRTAEGYTSLALVSVATAAFALAAGASWRRRRAQAGPLALAAAGALLLLGAELFFIRDVFFGSVPRLNTVFKLSYQSWILLSLAGAVGFAGALRDAAARRPAAVAGAAAAAAVLVASLIYPVIAIANRSSGLAGDRAIDGLDAVARADPAEYALLRWVETNVAPDEVLVEASGRRWSLDGGAARIIDASVDYTQAGRVSARTGRQTPIGWYFHEVQWRGERAAVQDELRRRQDLVDRVYLSSSPVESLAALNALGARYVVVGRVELAHYPAALLPEFDQFLDLVWERDGLRIYRLPTFETVGTS